MKRQGISLLTWVSTAGILLCEMLLFAHVRGWLPNGSWEFAGRFARANMTPLCWLFYLIFLIGMLKTLDGVSWFRRYRNRFIVCWLWSIPAWCYFDAMNFFFMVDGPNAFHRWWNENRVMLKGWGIHFYFMRDIATGLRAWEYINLPTRFDDRLLGYLFAFGAIAPGMFLTADVLQRVGFHRIKVQRVSAAPATARTQGRIALAVFLLGLVLTPIPIFLGTPASNLAIWVGTWALLDPINRRLGRPSILSDWFHGRWGRTLALGAGGLICGFLWEFWNYWAATKWIYHLPFLGPLEEYRYFEMPIAGLIGFIAFALETWAMWQTSLLILSPFVEGESKSPVDRFHHDHACL